MGVTLHLGDCLDVMTGMEPDSIDAIVTDPPYGLAFMGKDWDHGVPGIPFWEQALRVVKPGAHLLAFGGTRTYHRLAVAIEDAGWEIRDTIMWVYGSGFPKSHNVSKAIDKAAGAEREVVGVNGNGRPNRAGKHSNALAQAQTVGGIVTQPATPAAAQWDGWGTALKPAWEPIIVARKPLQGTVAANVLAWGTGALNVDGCRVGTDEELGRPQGTMPQPMDWGNKSKNGEVFTTQGNPSGRWPANVTHDGSDEVMAGFPETTSGGSGQHHPSGGGMFVRAGGNARDISDTGSAARFFYCASHDPLDLLFWRAKAIIGAWNQDLANTADNYSPLPSQHAVSVLSDAVTVVSRGDRVLSGATGLSTTVTPNELRLICETLTTAILSSEGGQSLDLRQGAHIPNGCLVSVAATPKQTDTTTITISLPKSGGFVESVTFNTTPVSRAVGEADLSARFKYCAKASKADRDEGLDGLPLRGKNEVYGNGLNTATKLDPALHTAESVAAWPQRHNHHPTVKPTDLMRWLVRLVTPPGGVVLDPFMGSGSTGKGAALEGFGFVGIDKEAEYLEIARRRIAAVRLPLFAALERGQ